MGATSCGRSRIERFTGHHDPLSTSAPWRAPNGSSCRRAAASSRRSAPASVGRCLAHISLTKASQAWPCRAQSLSWSLPVASLMVLTKRGVVLVHPAVDVVEEGVVVPGLLGVHQPQGQGLGDPADARAAAAVALAGVLAVLPLRRAACARRAPSRCRARGPRRWPRRSPSARRRRPWPRSSSRRRRSARPRRSSTLGKDWLMLASCSSPSSSPAKTMGSLRPLPCPPQPVQPGWPARIMPPRSMPTCTKFTSSGSFCSGFRSVQSSRAEMPDDAAVLQPVLRHVLHRLLEAEEARCPPRAAA